MFSRTDLLQIKQRDSDPDQVAGQIAQFQSGFPFLDIYRAAAVGSGIMRLESEEADRFVLAYDQLVAGQELVKFVPASGAASRMFKDLYSFMGKYDGSAAALEAFEADKGPKSMHAFFSQLADFAFFDDLKAAVGGEAALAALLESKKYGHVLKALLEEPGLNYGNLPKGLLKFHRYESGVRTPLEEHLVEGAEYAKGAGNIVQLHLTVSPEHRQRFEERLAAVVSDYEKAYGVRYEVSFSEQKGSTDTIAVDLENQPFREADGSLLFRPAGHGALLANLNEIDADLIFIKNIDNVVPDRIKTETIRYKKALAGVLLVYQRRLFDYYTKLEAATDADSALIDEVLDFLANELCVAPPADIGDGTWEAQRSYALEKLNRPIRVCGMVLNEGEAGGGPFWVRNEDGSQTLQILESVQINTEDPKQKSLMADATHFNPVDLVCGVRNGKGEKFDLMPFRDPQTGFISQKSKDGKDLRALELPGLWNGSMSNWNTLFVEVPIITFSPVKTVMDLLREEHQ